jgi:hypothetical protein
MGNPWARYSGAVLLGVIVTLAGSDAGACEPDFVVLHWSDTFTVPYGDCTTMTIKMWGNGGNTGFPNVTTGDGGGGAGIVAWYNVFGGQQFYGHVTSNVYPGPWYGGHATALYANTPSGVLWLMAGGGGGGGSTDQGENMSGGAGGKFGLPGQGGAGNNGPVGGGGGGSLTAGGNPGAGFYFGGYGRQFPCEPFGTVFPNPCGTGGSILGGHGGQGWFSGGGGGGDGAQAPNPENGRSGAGGGGGSSYQRRGNPYAIAVMFYNGDGRLPGNRDDPENHGAGYGAKGLPWFSQEGSRGKIVVLYNYLEILPKESSISQPKNESRRVIDIVFDSPVDLESAGLELTDSSGVSLTAHDESFRPVRSGELNRYRVRWTSEGVGEQALAEADLTVKVRGRSAGATFASSAYPLVDIGARATTKGSTQTR